MPGSRQSNTTGPASELADLPRLRVWLCVLVLLAVNIVTAARLFRVEYSAYNGSVEGTFIAIARVMAKHPFDWSWWPLWTMGMPFENSYVPFLHWIVAATIGVTGLSAARAFHLVSAAFYVAAAPALFWMALVLSRKLAASFIAALAYSVVSLSAILVPAIGADAGGALHPRRLQALVVYGEAPHIAALALLPVALVCFHRALTTRAVKWNLLAGVLAASVVLTNAFGMVALVLALFCWLAAFQTAARWNGAAAVVGIGVVSYCWTAPWLSPSLIRAVLDYARLDPENRYTPASWTALALLCAGFVLLRWALGRAGAAAHLQFFLLLGYVFTGIVTIAYAWHIYLLPEPQRYHLEMDLALMLALVFGAAAILDRHPRGIAIAVAVLVAAALAWQTVHSVANSRRLIRSANPASLAEYRIAKWLDENRHGQRAFLSGSSSFLYNVVTDNPQVHGGHAQYEVNPFIRIVNFTVYTGTNAGSRDAEYSIFWLKAVGAHTISVSGPNSTEYFRPFVHPRKFDGVLPLLWRDGDDAIYEVPGRSASLAHVMPASAVVTQAPSDGLHMAPAVAYVAALDDPRYPVAAFEWKDMSEARIRATVAPGQVIAVQETYDPGWEAWAGGRRLRVHQDGLGLMVIEPDSNGACEIRLRYTGGAARVVTRLMSLGAMLFAAIYAWRGQPRAWRGRRRA